MSYAQLALSLIFIAIPLGLAIVLKLGLEKDIIIATIRSIIQLLIIGYILTFVFESDSPIFIILMIMLMIAAATQNIIKKGDGIPGITWMIVLTLIVVETVTMGIMLSFGIIPFAPEEVIPISGMVIGNCMVLSLLFLNKFKDEVDRSDETIELILSMGGQPKVAIDKSLKSAIQTSMIPTIEAQKTMGLVQLPGMMSGLIIGGADPIEAVMYQLLILFLLLTTAAMSSAMVGYMAYPKLFNQKMQFIGLQYKTK
ncbi:ABC transporter permease [Salinicoccus roseus]|uniref:ABC transporter permease n=1 Tax=Salinicoccus roseus TaxID=45670 RepID=UPI001EF6F0E4|nr:iron export ABC transporter permease subunit FetB [Salinicoccus roseus]MCG7331702.1 iron export ABC transporter permease subunit FetB [Salinicoccus roseus]